MRKIAIAICAITMLMCITACQDNSVEFANPIATQKNLGMGPRVQELIQQARNGDAEAYKSLAICYRNGEGVEKSWLNDVYLHASYCKKTGEDIDSIVKFFDEDHPFRQISEILNVPSLDEKAWEKLEQLKQHAPAEAKTIGAIIVLVSEENPEKALTMLHEAEDEGSELSSLFQYIYYEQADRKDEYEQCLIRQSAKYPFLNLKIGEIYIGKYWESEDFTDIQKAMEYYYKADAYGMLTPKHANGLLNIYKHFGKQGLLDTDEKEIERLTNIAKTES